MPEAQPLEETQSVECWRCGGSGQVSVQVPLSVLREMLDEVNAEIKSQDSPALARRKRLAFLSWVTQKYPELYAQCEPELVASIDRHISEYHAEDAVANQAI